MDERFGSCPDPGCGTPGPGSPSDDAPCPAPVPTGAAAGRTPVARIHSLESCGTVDGPGIRYVVFFQGCAYRCLYCHNPDTWAPGEGREIGLQELLKEIRGVAGFIKKSGGVTASGGEPLLQAAFVAEFFRRLRREGFHTTLDTTGMILTPDVHRVLDNTSLVMLDLKGMGDATHRLMTGHGQEGPLRFAEELRRRNIPIWFRFVLVPGYTDDEAHLEALADYVATFPSAQRLDVLPFHKMGEFKWEALKRDYRLKDVEEPTLAGIARAQEILSRSGLEIH